MAQYKVPQDVEADDKLLGPFSFRQFIYLVVAAALIAVAVFLWQIFPLLSIIPVPLALLMVILALPLKKDQPMETYLVALMSYYFKPRKRIWIPGQRETTIEISAPKVAEKTTTRNISSEEASHRLSFLADIVDTEGQSIKGSMSADFVAEANNVQDIYDITNTNNLNSMIEQEASERRAEIINSMRNAASDTPATPQVFHGITITPTSSKISTTSSPITPPEQNPNKTPDNIDESTRTKPEQNSSTPTTEKSASTSAPAKPTEPTQSKNTKEDTETTDEGTKKALTALSKDPDLSISTISKEANRIKNKKKDEVYISLH